MTELTEKEQETLNSARVVRAEGDVLLPLLQARERLIIGRTVSAFKAGETGKLISLAAELSTIYDLKSAISQKISEADYLEKKMMSDEGERR